MQTQSQSPLEGNDSRCVRDMRNMEKSDCEERGLPYMTSTGFWYFLPPPSSLSAKSILFVLKFGAYLCPIPTSPSVRTSYIKSPKRAVAWVGDTALPIPGLIFLCHESRLLGQPTLFWTDILSKRLCDSRAGQTQAPVRVSRNR